MLVLSRKSGESFGVGDNVVIHILGRRGREISIGIDAPREIPVVRTEIKRREPLTPADLGNAAGASDQAEATCTD
jgi:carbon storage regulator